MRDRETLNGTERAGVLTRESGPVSTRTVSHCGNITRFKPNRVATDIRERENLIFW